MRRSFSIFAATLTVMGGFALASPGQAQALRLGAMPGMNTALLPTAVEQVQWQGGRGGPGGGWRGNPGWNRGGGWRGNPGWNRGWAGNPGWRGNPGWNRGWAGNPGWRGGGWGPGWNGGWGWNRQVVVGPGWGWGGGWGGGCGWGNCGWGPGAGFATGVILGSAVAASAAPAPVYGSNAVAYCSARFRSYNPATGTYLGYDGRRHSCP